MGNWAAAAPKSPIFVPPGQARWRRFRDVLERQACPEDERFLPLYPGVRYVPKVGSLVNHRLFARDVTPAVRSVTGDWRPDVVLAAWVYPDGCGAARAGPELGLPVVVIAQGTDIHQYLRMPVRSRVIRRTLCRVSAVVTRSRDMAGQVVAAGVPSDRVHTIYNGVDLDLFTPGDLGAARAQLGLPEDARVVLFVGHLTAIKDPLLLVRAFALLRAGDAEAGWRLVLVGDGELRREVEREVEARGLGERVVLAGERRPADVVRFMQAADVLAVPSRNEGVPNVIREAFACGLPVVATRVGGVPEVVDQPFLGRLVEWGEEEEMARGLCEMAATGRSERERVRACATGFSWAKTVDGYVDTLADAIAGGGSHGWTL